MVDWIAYKAKLVSEGQALYDRILPPVDEFCFKTVKQVNSVDTPIVTGPSLLEHPFTEYVVTEETFFASNCGYVEEIPSSAVYKHFSSSSANDDSLVTCAVPPSRRLDDISGQLKLAVDVALTLQFLLRTDTVDVVGSGGDGSIGGASYLLLAGVVSTVDLYDPLNTRADVVIKGTEFRYHTRCFTEADSHGTVLFNDAFDSFGLPVYVNVAPYRVYSVKFFDSRLLERGKDRVFYDFREVDRWPRGEFVKYETRGRRSVKYDVGDSPRFMTPDRGSYTYGQICKTHCEVRRTYPPRPITKYCDTGGTCSACVEVGYRSNYRFSKFQDSVWKMIHLTTACIKSNNISTYFDYKYVDLLTLSVRNYPLNCADSDGAVMISSLRNLYSCTTNFSIHGVCYSLQRVLEPVPLDVSAFSPGESSYVRGMNLCVAIPPANIGDLFYWASNFFVIFNDVYRYTTLGVLTWQELNVYGVFYKICCGESIRFVGRVKTREMKIKDFINFLLIKLSLLG